MIWLLLGTALAQEGGSEGPWWLGCGTFVPERGLPSSAMRRQVLQTNAELYGVMQTTKEDLFPKLDAGGPEENATAFLIGMRSLWGAERVPTLSVNNCDKGPAMGSIDVFTSNFALGSRVGPVGVFYATTVQGALQTANPIGRSYGTYFGSGLALLYAPVAPFVGSGGNNTLRWDWVFGAQAHFTEQSVARVGYLGSKGLYTNVDDQWTSLFLRSAIRTKQAEGKLPFFEGGANALPELANGAGNTRIFGRKLVWYLEPPKPADEDVAENNASATLEEAGRDLITGHLEQNNIAGVVDLKASWTFQPSSQVHDLLVGVHTPYFDAPGHEESSPTGPKGVRVVGGITRLPAAWFYGVQPGVYPTFAVDGGWGGEASFWLVRLRYNHADVLDVFPSAANGLSIQFQTGFMAL